VFISPDGASVIATDGSDPTAEQVLLWQRSTGWQVLPSVFGSSVVYAVSRDFKSILGGGSVANGLFDLWVRAIDGMENVLPSPASFARRMTVVSNGGNTVLGSYVPGGDVFSPTAALRWDNGGEPTVMHSPDGDTLAEGTACDADCSIVFGDGFYIPDNSTKPHSRDAWYLKNDGAFGHLGALADAVSLGWYYVNSVTPDGTLATGSYVVGDPVYGQAVRAFVWTQATGIVSVRSLVAELGIGDDDWSSQRTANISPDGEKILLTGWHKSTVYPQPDGYSRAVVLRLLPKASPN
jgi:hypothetical protein